MFSMKSVLACAHIYAYLWKKSYKRLVIMCTHTYIYIYIYTHTNTSQVSNISSDHDIYIYIYIYIYIHTPILHVCSYEYML